MALPFSTPSLIHAFVVKASGGSGQFEWHSQHPAVVGVWVSGASAAGVGVEARFQSRTAPTPTTFTGSGLVAAHDRCNRDNRALVQVKVSAPARLQFLPSALEIQTDTQLELGVELLSHDLIPYSNCSALVCLSALCSVLCWRDCVVWCCVVLCSLLCLF